MEDRVKEKIIEINDKYNNDNADNSSDVMIHTRMAFLYPFILNTFERIQHNNTY